MVETWLITCIFLKKEDMNKVILAFVKPKADMLAKEGSIRTFHFFREEELTGLKRPYILFRVAGEKQKIQQLKTEMERELENLKGDGTIADYKIPLDPSYTEEKHYSKDGWKIAQKFYEYSSKVALFLLYHRTRNIELPRDFREEKLVHCFLNQSLGPYSEEVNFYIRRLLQLGVLKPAPGQG